MFCKNCGAKIAENAVFCSACGTARNRVPVQTENIPPAVSGGYVGFSPRITDPAFASYIKKSNRWAVLFSVVIAIVAVVGFFIAGETSDEMSNPSSLFIGMAIAAMFLIIAAVQMGRKKKSRTWDGTVVDKRAEKKSETVSYGDEYRHERYIQYSVIIQSDEGRRHSIREKNNAIYYSYFSIGDRVRHHAGLETYEKYDKSRDTEIFCNACRKRNNIQNEICTRCKCPILK